MPHRRRADRASRVRLAAPGLFVLLAATGCAFTAGSTPPKGPASGAATGTVAGSTPGGGSSPAATASAFPGEPPPREDGRLPGTAVPRRYALRFDVDPRREAYRGDARILVRVPAATRFVVLHGRGIAVDRAFAETASGRAPARVRTRKSTGALADDEIVLAFDQQLPTGDATLDLSFSARFGETLSGMYRVQEDGRWYAFTDFEPADARAAFPCFDEPQFKVPFDVSVTVPKGLRAVANGRETGHVDDADATTFSFATTAPLPTYLVAVGVGELDTIESKSPPAGIPLRVVTTKGRAHEGELALAAAEQVVVALGDWFGVRYPYDKLDLVAVPDFSAGAMENAGMITFREELLLYDTQRASPRQKRLLSLYVAHETAHQWFGDLVTMEWWNDLWLNEGFATWMETKIVDKLHPEYKTRLEGVAWLQAVMNTDALASARAVRQPVRTTGEATEAFDGLTYEKGAAVLGMVESYVGEAAFQRGVRDYVRAHAWGNARAEDLVGAIERASGRHVSDVMASFLDQTGVPAVAVEKQCNGAHPTLSLTQFPWQPVGAALPTQPLKQWKIPLCLATPGAKEPTCMELAEHRVEVPAPGGKCPAWIVPNPSETGYYRYALPQADVKATLRDAAGSLDAAGRLGLVANLWAQTRAGSLDADALLGALPLLDGEKDAFVVRQEIDVLKTIGERIVDEADRPRFRAYVAARLGARKRALGWTRKPTDDEEKTTLRTDVLEAMSELADDAATLTEAEAIARKWLEDPGSVDPDVGPLALRIASRKAGAPRFEALVRAAREAKRSQDRIAALKALGGFDDPELLARALDWAMTNDEVRRQDVRYVLGTELARRAGRPVAYAWIKAHWEAGIKKLPGPLGRHLFDAVTVACGEDEIKDARAFFTARAPLVEGAARPYAEAIEAATLCSSLRTSIGPEVARFFHGH